MIYQYAFNTKQLKGILLKGAIVHQQIRKSQITNYKQLKPPWKHSLHHRLHHTLFLVLGCGVIKNPDYELDQIKAPKQVMFR